MGKENRKSKAVSEVQEKVKRCPCCKKLKSENDFYRDKGKIDGCDFYCKKCRRIVFKKKINKKFNTYYIFLTIGIKK